MKNIKFIHENKLSKEIVTSPVPAKIKIPKWYKDSNLYVNNKLSISKTGNVNTTYKACMPFFDALSFGYIIELHCDVLIQKNNNKTEVSWSSTLDPCVPRDSQVVDSIPNYPGFDKNLQAWKLYWNIKTPKNFSCIVGHPFNRPNLPFFTTTGIVDTDMFHSSGAIPFSLEKNFEGIIPAGTPIISIIPFQRNDWKMKIEDPDESLFFQQGIARNKFIGWYKKNMWQRKKFE